MTACAMSSRVREARVTWLVGCEKVTCDAVEEADFQSSL